MLRLRSKSNPPESEIVDRGSKREKKGFKEKVGKKLSLSLRRRDLEHRTSVVDRL